KRSLRGDILVRSAHTNALCACTLLQHVAALVNREELDGPGGNGAGLALPALFNCAGEVRNSDLVAIAETGRKQVSVVGVADNGVRWGFHAAAIQSIGGGGEHSPAQRAKSQCLIAAEAA